MASAASFDRYEKLHFANSFDRIDSLDIRIVCTDFLDSRWQRRRWQRTHIRLHCDFDEVELCERIPQLKSFGRVTLAVLQSLFAVPHEFRHVLVRL